MAFCDDAVRKAMDVDFAAGFEQMTGKRYMAWLAETHRAVDWHGVPQSILNAHVVLLWVMFNRRKDFLFVYSGPSATAS
jgi:hypothetical protein